MKKAVIAAATCFAVGLVGVTVSLPMVAKDVISIYNNAVSENAQSYERQDLPAEVSELRIVNQDSMGNILIEVRQSPDQQVHFQVLQSKLFGYEVEVRTEGTKSEIWIKDVPRHNMQIDKEILAELIREEINYQNRLILEVPKTVTLTSSEADGVYLGVDGGVEFVNAPVIRDFGYVPSENQNWKLEYEDAQNQIQQLEYQIEDLKQENQMLEEKIASFYGEAGVSEIIINPMEDPSIEYTIEGDFDPTDVIRLEVEFSQQKERFVSGQLSKEQYIQELEKRRNVIEQLRLIQLDNAGREDLIGLVQMADQMILEYNRIDAQIVEVQRDLEEGLITQQQYNTIVQAYETSMREISEKLEEYKTSLQEQGYDWDSAVF